jgi:hypothetical protein
MVAVRKPAWHNEHGIIGDAHAPVDDTPNVHHIGVTPRHAHRLSGVLVTVDTGSA